MIDLRLLIFARAPVPGATKTRLIPALGADGAARLHAALVRHALTTATAAAPRALQLWVTGDDPDGLLAALASEHGAALHEQSGGDLGARMAHALSAATADGVPAIILGSDCPWITASVIRESAALLGAADAVLGPADDGGYVLLGLHRVVASLFEGVEWGRGNVLEATRERLGALDWRWRELPARPDVDRPEDLAALARLGQPWARLAGVEPS
ncbi:MAG: TIGR04282 family arsenosugar biosynthesis glycosyltransferase [Halofilum sp. (in: g-proteobacteria)]